MTEIHELATIPLHDLTERVQNAPTIDEKKAAFGDWILHLHGIEGVHDPDQAIDVIHAEFGPQAAFTAVQIRHLQREIGARVGKKVVSRRRTDLSQTA